MFKPYVNNKVKKFKITKSIPINSVVPVADSSGAKFVKIVGFKNKQGADKRRLSGGVGCKALVTVIKGKFSLKKKVLKALIIRQKSAITRFTGSTLGKIKFKDNAVVLLNENWKPTKDVIKGPVAKEVLSIRPVYSNLNATFK